MVPQYMDDHLPTHLIDAAVWVEGVCGSIFNQKRNYAAPSSRAPASFDDKAQAANAEFYFRATGYNSSLKKRVVFEGNYIASSSAAQKKAAEAKAEERDEQTPARITGTAKIAGESPLQIDAIAVAK